MTDFEASLAEEFYEAIQDMSARSERSAQDKEFVLGVSNVGWCAERFRRALAHITPDKEPDLLDAWIGTQLGSGMEEAYKRRWPNAILQAEVTLTLVGDTGTYMLPGHPDIIDPDKGLVLDGKTVETLAYVQRHGASQQQRFQRHGYAMAAWEAGLFGDRALEDIQVGNVWMDRSGNDKFLHVEIEPFDLNVIHEMAEWVDQVVYAYQQGEEAEKTPPRTMCAVVCGHYRRCRAYETDAEGRIREQSHLDAVQMVLEGRAMEKEGKRMIAAGKEQLEGVSGLTQTHVVRQVMVEATESRKAHTRLALDPL